MIVPESSFDMDLLARIEEAGLNASAPPQQLLIDGWLVRFSPGKARRARSVNAVAPGRLPLAEKLTLCRRVFDEAGLPMLMRLTPFSQPEGLAEQLAQIGMRSFELTGVMVNPQPQALGPEPLPAGTTLAPIGHEAFAQIIGGLRGSTLAQRQAHGQRIVNSPVPFLAHVIKREGEVVGCGQYALEGALVGLYDVFTTPSARGQGLARLLCSHLLAEAVARGATTAYLQVDSGNHPARAVYRRLGFADAYTYHYMSSDPDAA